MPVEVLEGESRRREQEPTGQVGPQAEEGEEEGGAEVEVGVGVLVRHEEGVWGEKEALDESQ